MQQCVIRQSRLKSHLLLAQPWSRKRPPLGSVLTKMYSNVRWAFNFTKWDPSHADLLQATSCIQPEEKERLAKFVFKNDFKSSLIGRLMMRKFVSETKGAKYDEIRFLRDEKGKPFLREKDFEGINFNVSHQGDFTVMAGCVGGGLLGVDVVKMEFPRGKTLDEYFRVMKRTFSEREWQTIKCHERNRDKLAAFCRHWCLKESYLKAVGIGVTINLQDVSFKINTNSLKNDVVVDDTEVFFRAEKQTEWVFHEMLLDDEHCAAVAMNFKNETLLFREVGFAEIMENAVALLDLDNDYCGKFFQKCDRN